MSQSELAKKCGLSQQYISLLEADTNGVNLPTLPIIARIGKALNINPRDLIEYKSKP